MFAALPLKVLILEDRPSDAELILDELRQSGYEPDWKVVDSEADFLASLDPAPEIILADYSLPSWDAPSALHVLHERGLDIPLIMLSGTVGEELAVSILKQGAADYLLKDRLARLGQAVEHALEAKKLRDQQRQSEEVARVRARLQKVMGTLGILALQSKSPIALMNAAVENVASALEVEYCSSFELLADGQTLVLRAAIGWNPELVGAATLTVEPSSQAAYILQAHSPVIVQDYKSEARFTAPRLLEDYGIVSGMSVIIRGYRQPIGVLGVFAATPRTFTADDAYLLQGVADILTTAIERKRAEDAIRKLHTAVEQSGSSVIITDLQGNIEYVNLKFTEVTGYAADEVIGQNPRILKSGETPPQVYKDLWETIMAGREWRGEFHNRKKNGELFWELASISPVKDEMGRIINFLAVKEDITARKQIEAELAHERNLLRTLIDSLPDRIYAKDAEGRFTLKNEADTRQMGAASTTEMIGKTDFDYYPVEIAERYHADDQTVIMSGQPLLEQEEPFIAADGSKGWMLTSKVPLRDNKGNVIGLVGIGRDITERKRAEEKVRQSETELKQAQQVAHVGSWAWYIQSNRLVWSDEMFRLFDLEKETFQGDLGEVIKSAIHPDDRAAVEQANASVINTGTPIPLEYRIVRSDGTVRTVWAEAGELRLDSEGNPEVLTGIVQDITARKESEQKLRKLNRTLALLSDVNQAIVRIPATSGLFEKVCRIAVEQGGFRMAWVGILDTETQKVNPVASFGVVEDYLEKREVVLNDTPRGQGPTASAIRTGHHVIANDIEHDTSMVPWREDALRLGYRAMAAFPLIVTGEVRGILGLYAHEPGFFDDAELKILDEMASDIAFAMEFAQNEAQRRQAELALKQHVRVVEDMQVFLQTTLDAFPAHTVVLNTDGTIINVNESWIRFADENGALSSMHYLGANYLTVCDTADGPWSEEAAPAAASIRAVIEGQKENFQLEYPCNSPSEERWFQLQATPFPEAVPRRVVLAHINITERKQAENALRNAYEVLEQRVVERTAQLRATKERVEAILNNSTDAILLVDADLTIQQTNFSFNRMFGCNPDDYFGKSLSDLIDSDAAEDVDSIRQAVEQRKSVNIDVNARRKNGTIFASELSIGLIGGDGLVCTFHDITERKKVEQSLQLAFAKEKELNELKTRFVSMASHEFRTPLATIYATTETLSAYRHRLTDDQIVEKLSNISEQVKHLNDIMDDVLNLARLQARRFEFKPEICNLDAICREIIEEFEMLPNVTHHLLYTCRSPVPEVLLDKKLMRQIISNLLSNAIKYSPDGKTIEMNLEYRGEALALSVQDRGIGIPEADLAHLFEPFHRAHNVGTIHGTGLGLVIAKEAIDLHGGTITVESQVGIGTTFTVHIPIWAQGE